MKPMMMNISLLTNHPTKQVMDQIADLKQLMVQGFVDLHGAIANINRHFDNLGLEPETNPQPHHDQDHNN
jgi:acetylglutamate kinase